MGGRIITLMFFNQKISQVVGAVEGRNGACLVGKDVGEALGIGKNGCKVDDDLNGCIEKGDVGD